MISSLFIRPPRDSDEIVFNGPNTPPPGRVVPVDSAKTGLASAHPEAGGHVENRALLIPRLKWDRETGAKGASLFAIYSNRKSTVSRVRGFFFAVTDYFSRRRNADPFRPRKRDAKRSGEPSGAAAAARLAPRCSNLVSEHRGGSLVVADRRNRRRVRCGLARFRLPLESELEHLVHPFHRKNFQPILDVVRDFCQILHVLVRDEDSLDAAPVRSEKLFLQAAYDQHFAAQGDLAGHGEVRANRDSGQHRHHRGADADPGAGTVLGRRAFGEVHVNVVLLIEVLGDSEPG